MGDITAEEAHNLLKAVKEASNDAIMRFIAIILIASKKQRHKRKYRSIKDAGSITKGKTG